MALAYEEQQKAGKWGGDLRHHQNDFSGGTDLYDLETAWAAYGEDLKIKTGQGWTDGVKYWHNEGRAIVAQGTGECPGSGTYDGAHAAIIGVETHSDGRWLFGDPLVSGWQWVEPGQIKAWMERFHSGCAFATGLRDYAEPPEPEPPQPEPEPPQPGPEPEPPVITTPVAPVGWVPLLPSWALWDNGYWDAEEWHLAEAVWPIGWAEKVPIWDSTDWVGSWY
jgi:hypothetical protein